MFSMFGFFKYSLWSSFRLSGNFCGNPMGFCLCLFCAMRTYQKLFCQTAECTKKTKTQTTPPASHLPKKIICFTYYPQRSLEIELCRYKIKMLLKTIIFPGLRDMLKNLFYYFSLFNSFLLLFFSNQLIMWNHPLKSRNFKVKKFSVKNVSFSCSEARKEILCT